MEIPETELLEIGDWVKDESGTAFGWVIGFQNPFYIVWDPAMEEWAVVPRNSIKLLKKKDVEVSYALALYNQQYAMLNPGQYN